MGVSGGGIIILCLELWRCNRNGKHYSLHGETWRRYTGTAPSASFGNIAGNDGAGGGGGAGGTVIINSNGTVSGISINGQTEEMEGIRH